MRFSWYACHTCGWEAPLSDGVRNVRGCENLACIRPVLHVHSNADGELPKKIAHPNPACPECIGSGWLHRGFDSPGGRCDCFVRP